MRETIICYDGTKVVLDDRWYKKVNAICNNVLKDIKPNPKEQEEKLNKVNVFCSKLQKVLGGKATIVLGGSLGKETNLR